MQHFEIRPIPEVPLETVPPEEFELVRAALHNPQFQFRTITGIHQETEVPLEHVAAVLDNSELARVSVMRDKKGDTIYAPKEQKKTVRERVATILYILAH
ncbi:MAG: hypothetical protein JWL89_322 [Candidatus Saccharibacteria bacterium]|jgi:hypothetical protein|nr:hypothetical protein [Candidatus Saccharibacteria bacterium]